MAKTVNATVVVTRDGKTDVVNYEKLSYQTFVALQASLASVLSMLQAWGAIRAAAIADGRKTRKPGGECDLKMELRADHGGGTSEVSLAYTGISAADADEIQRALMGAAASVFK